MHAGLGCRRGTRATLFQYRTLYRTKCAYVRVNAVSKRNVFLQLRFGHFRIAKMLGRTNGFSDE